MADLHARKEEESQTTILATRRRAVIKVCPFRLAPWWHDLIRVTQAPHATHASLGLFHPPRRRAGSVSRPVSEGPYRSFPRDICLINSNVLFSHACSQFTFFVPLVRAQVGGVIVITRYWASAFADYGIMSSVTQFPARLISRPAAWLKTHPDWVGSTHIYPGNGRLVPPSRTTL